MDHETPAGRRSRWPAMTLRDLATDAGAGLAAAILAIAYCLSFSALLFQGALHQGLAMGLWALLVGSAITGLYISLATSIPPIAAGPNNPAVAVLSVLAGGVSAAVLAAGGNAEAAVAHVLFAFALATLATGLVLYAIGRAQLGQYVRFVPYPVIGGFLAASGWFLAAGGIRVVTGQPLLAPLPAETWPKLAVAAAFAAGVHALKHASDRMNALPLAFVAATAILDIGLWLAGLREPGSGWYLEGTSEPAAWNPVRTWLAGTIDTPILAAFAAEIASAAGVTVVALLLDVSSLEVSRAKPADLDWEFRTNGAAGLISAPLGGVMGKLSVNATRLVDETGGRTRASGVIAALIVAAVAAGGVDLARAVPAPILGGLVIYVGLTGLAEVLFRSPAQRAWSDYALALLIMATIVGYGYLAGVVLGFVGACLMFALSYSRIDVVRRHLTRDVYASNVDRSAAAARVLQEEGSRIHIFWLSGYVFFGSAHRLYETMAAAMGPRAQGQRRFAVLDLAGVAGFDTSALLSLVKLRNHAADHRTTLTFAGLDERTRAAFERLGLIGNGQPHRTFSDRNAALEWCENEILAEVLTGPGAGEPDIEAWLAGETGSREHAARILRVLERRVMPAGAAIYRQGDPAGSIDLVAEGSVAVSVRGEPGSAEPAHVVRRMAKRTVVGEMGFFRAAARTATVTAEPGTVIYTLSREAYERLMVEEPRVAAAFLEFIVRAMADRLEFANAGIAALN